MLKFNKLNQIKKLYLVILGILLLIFTITGCGTSDEDIGIKNQPNYNFSSIENFLAEVTPIDNEIRDNIYTAIAATKGEYKKLPKKEVADMCFKIRNSQRELTKKYNHLIEKYSNGEIQEYLKLQVVLSTKMEDTVNKLAYAIKNDNEELGEIAVHRLNKLLSDWETAEFTRPKP